MAISRHYFITGVSAGIGKALTEALLAQGHKVTGIARRSDRLAEIAQAHHAFHPITCDVSDKEAIHKAVEQAIQHFGPIDVLIPNAGIYWPDKTGVIDVSSFETHMQVNYMASIYCVNACLPAMLASKTGHIALMASVAGYRGLPRSTAYGPTKAALINFGEALRFDLKDTGVKIQIICPGFVETEATSVNDFEMPGLITAEQAAEHIITGLASHDFEIAFPKNFVRKMKWLKFLSNDLYFKLVSQATKNTKR